MKKKICLWILSLILSLGIYAQGGILKPIKWDIKLEQISSNEALLTLKGSIDASWIVYGLDNPSDGPLPISIKLDQNKDFSLVNSLTEVKPAKVKYDELFEMQVRYFEKEVLVQQILKFSEGITTLELKGSVEAQGCNDTECVLLNEDFATQINIDTKPSASKDSLFAFFLIALLAGFAGVFTPCVFPMLPMTVSFFIRGNSRTQGIRKALMFGASIIFIYTAIGALVTITKSADMTNTISTHWFPNLLFFALFITFAISFLGAMEISLPTKLTNRIDNQVDKGGYFATFFVALALTLISFSCTGPFVGALLVAGASGAILKPIIGMFGFGLAFALPFTLLALFPSRLKKLPKSGGWMNTIKVVFAFILLLFSIKFLSVADQGLGINFISREIFLCIWITLFILLGLYFLGKLRFAHDDQKQSIKASNFLVALFAFSFALYLFTGFMGNQLNSISSFLPQESEIRNELTENKPQKLMTTSLVDNSFLCNKTPKYSELNFHSPANLPAFFDLKEALACAEEQGKRVFIDFKGHYCANCKKMEGTVFAENEVQDVLLENFVIVTLYTDDKTELPKELWYTSSFDKKIKKTIGQQNLDYLISTFKVNAIPYFALLDSKGEPQGEPIAYTNSTKDFLKFLQQ
ncbi:MAG: protein-disulfide reductase DsbD family protein [Bacteroidales bacterium]